MNGFKQLFSPPHPPTYELNSFPSELIWIPSNKACKIAGGTSSAIPCLFLSTATDNNNKSTARPHDDNHSTVSSSSPSSSLPSSSDSTKEDLVIVFCHGNGYDLGTTYGMLKYYRSFWNCHIICIEYPSYGYYKSILNENSLNTTLLSVIEFLQFEHKYPLDRIVLFGHSIGSGLVCEIASTYARNQQYFGGIILQSPFTSINDVEVFKQRLASSSHLYEKFTIDNRCWSNIIAMESIRSPLLIIHGKQDDLIPCGHSEQLYNASISTFKHLLLCENATHNSFEYDVDIIRPVNEFLNIYFRSKYSTEIRTSIMRTSLDNPKSYSLSPSPPAAAAVHSSTTNSMITGAIESTALSTMISSSISSDAMQD